MAEAEIQSGEKEFFLDIPQQNETFFLKGSANYDWGMKNRLARRSASISRVNPPTVCVPAGTLTPQRARDTIRRLIRRLVR